MTSYLSPWGVDQRSLLHDPTADSPLYLGIEESIPQIWLVAAPPADFQPPFRCRWCGLWLKNSELMFERASNKIKCEVLQSEVKNVPPYARGRYSLSCSARDQLANIAQIWAVLSCPTVYPIRCPHCRNFFVSHRCLSEHAWLVFNSDPTDPKFHNSFPGFANKQKVYESLLIRRPQFSNACLCDGMKTWLTRRPKNCIGRLRRRSFFNLARWVVIAEHMCLQELNCRIDMFKLLRMVPKERRTAHLLAKVVLVLKLAGPFVGAICLPSFGRLTPKEMSVDIPGNQPSFSIPTPKEVPVEFPGHQHKHKHIPQGQNHIQL